MAASAFYKERPLTPPTDDEDATGYASPLVSPGQSRTKSGQHDQTDDAFHQRDTHCLEQRAASSTLHIKNLPTDIRDSDIEGLISGLAGKKRSRYRWRTRHDRPSCFVEFESIAFAKKALKELDSSQISGVHVGFCEQGYGFSAEPCSEEAPEVPDRPSDMEWVETTDDILPPIQLPTADPTPIFDGTEQVSGQYVLPQGSSHKERPLKCEQCPQSFISNNDLKRHKRIHLVVKSFHCPGCEKSFSRQDALKVGSKQLLPHIAANRSVQRHHLVKGCGKRPATSTRECASQSEAGFTTDHWNNADVELIAGSSEAYMEWDSQPERMGHLLRDPQDEQPSPPISFSHEQLPTVDIYKSHLDEIKFRVRNDLLSPQKLKSRVSLQIEWNLSQFVRGQYADFSKVDLGSVIVINGSALQAQATTCSAYVNIRWPLYGGKLLALFQRYLEEDSHIVKGLPSKLLLS